MQGGSPSDSYLGVVPPVRYGGGQKLLPKTTAPTGAQVWGIPKTCSAMAPAYHSSKSDP